ncbi:hypothetical protein BDZ94DRAFT_100059 [Collybia nuda]|uniref:PGG domain-containing protein n=1 Tax=Collybia nuda TaxID=64659 RepID=A0A9P5XVR0_9AGAR|nr:hypothetical protein BDZ94DRAFT_100059 [Collybia nuda]
MMKIFQDSRPTQSTGSTPCHESFCDDGHSGPAPQVNKVQLPDHWKAPVTVKGNVLAHIHLFLFRALCLLSVGHKLLRQTYIHAHPGAEVWNESKARIRIQHRIENTTVVGALLLTTTAVFLTTVPPVQHTLDYLAARPYVCILLSFGLSLGSLVVGSAVIFVISTCSIDWFEKKLTRTRARIYCILILIAYPYISVGFAASICAVAVVLAARLSESRLINIGSIVVILFPASTFPLFAWVTI